MNRVKEIQAILAGGPRRLLLQIRKGTPAKALKEEIRLVQSVLDCLDEADRFHVMSSLSKIRNNLTRGVLVKTIRSDASPLVRHEAAFALGWVGDETCVETLRAALAHDQSFLVRHEAAMALAELGATQAKRALRRGLKDTSHEVVVSCQVALARLNNRSTLRHVGARG